MLVKLISRPGVHENKGDGGLDFGQVFDLFGQFLSLLGLFHQRNGKHGIRIGSFHLLFEFGDHSAQSGNIFAKLLSIGGGHGPPIRGSGLRPVHSIGHMRVRRVGGRLRRRRRATPLLCGAPRRGSAARIPAIPVSAKSTRRRDSVISPPRLAHVLRPTPTFSRFRSFSPVSQ